LLILCAAAGPGVSNKHGALSRAGKTGYADHSFPVQADRPGRRGLPGDERRDETLVRQNPGFIDVKSYTAQDGERLTVVWWRDEQSLAEWRNQMRHREAQNTGRQKWYEYYNMEVASVARSRSFVRK
jgi:heme-degrading monooxygenase HmoA